MLLFLHRNKDQQKNRKKLAAYARDYRKAHPEKVKMWRERAASRIKEKAET